MRRAGAPFDFLTWFAEFVMSAEATRRVRAYCRQYGMTSYDATDDVRSDWYLKVLGTYERNGLPVTVVDAEQATPYVLVAAKRVAHDHACRGFRAREEVSDPDLLPARPASTVVEASDPQADPTAWMEHLRSVVTERFQSGGVTCSGCAPAAVVQYALAVAALIGDEDASDLNASESARSISGGATLLARYLYEVIERIHPERFDVDDQGRVAPRTRAYKKRCEPCVLELLLDAVEGPSHTGGGSDVSSEDHGEGDRDD